MLESLKARANVWALQKLGRDSVDYLAANTMTVVNRRLNDFLWTYELKALVTAVIDEAPGVKTFVLQPNQHWKGMTPGQYVEVSAVIGSELIGRCYSPTVRDNGQIAITIKRVEGGRFSEWAHSQLQVGSELRLNPAEGRFCHQGQGKVLFLCAGSGMTPCHSIVSALLAAPETPDIAVYAQFAHARDVIFANALQDWRRQLDVEVALSRETRDGFVAPLTAESLVMRFPDFRERDIYLCGPSGFMDKMVEILAGLDFNLSRLHSERFALPVAESGADFDFRATLPEVYFRHLDRHVQLTADDEGKSLLQLAEDYGVPLESGCRKGMCGTCKLTLRDGKVSGNTLGQAVYLCSSYPASVKVVLDA